MKLKAVIFDLDGTLIDSMKIWDNIAEDYLLSLGIQPHENLKETFKNMSFKQSAKYYQDEYGVNKTVEEIMHEINTMVENFYLYEVSLKEYVREYIFKLLENNIKMCVATATDRYLVEGALSRLGIINYFCEKLTCSEVGFGKDEPVIYEEALKRLGTKKDTTIVFEDALHAIKTAKNAGFVVVGVYDQSENNQEKVKELSKYYIKDFRDMEDILK